MYKDVMLSQLEAKAKQLAKIEYKIQNNTNNQVSQNNNNTNGYIYPVERLPPEGSGDVPHNSFFHNHRRPPPSGYLPSEHHKFTVLPPAPDARRDEIHGERNRSRQRSSSVTQVTLKNQRLRSSSTGNTLRRRHHVDTSSRNSLLSDGVSSSGIGGHTSKVGMNCMVDNVPPNRPRPNLHLFPSETDRDSDIRAVNLNNDNLESTRAKHFNGDITANLHTLPNNYNSENPEYLHNQIKPQYNHSHVNRSVGQYDQQQVSSGYQDTSSYAYNSAEEFDRGHQTLSNTSGNHTFSHITDGGKSTAHMYNVLNNQNGHPPLPNGIQNQNVTYRRPNSNEHIERSMSYRHTATMANTKHNAVSRDRKPRYSYNGKSVDHVSSEMQTVQPRGRSLDPIQRHIRTGKLYTPASSEVPERPPLPEYEESVRHRHPLYRATEI